MAKTERKGGMARTVAAVVLGGVAAKIATKGAEKIWTKGFRQDVPLMQQGEPLMKKAAWLALSSALVGVARELARDFAAPKAQEA
jgi:hypothetical protein